MQHHAHFTFVGHLSPIVQVTFNAEYDQIISVDTLEIIKIFSVTDQVCLNTLSDVIPHTMMFMRQPLASFIWHAASQSVLTCSGSELHVLQLSRDDKQTSSQTTHTMPINCAAVISEYVHATVPKDSILTPVLQALDEDWEGAYTFRLMAVLGWESATIIVIICIGACWF